ncbi:MAG: IPT/TIG domain-containing protein [Candidatus Geothermincolia bacterium]
MRRTAFTVFALALLVAAVVAGTVPASAQPLVPFILNLTPSQGIVGTPVLITGSNFGAANPLSTVTFNGVQATVVAWTDGAIGTSVPEGATTGPVVVRTPFGASNGVQFTVGSIPQPAQTWYLAEGSTAWGFDTYLLMENVTNIDATVYITYNTAQFGVIPRPQPLNVPPSSRVTLRLNDDIPNVDLSTQVSSSQLIVCERAIYWNNRIEGSDSVGTTAPATTWYLAEGCTTYPFETWLCIQNPSLIAAANVDVTYMTSKGVVAKPTISVGAGQRKTIDVSKDVGACDVSTQVVSDLNVICERSMYWDSRRGGHDSIGVSAPSETWYLAEGTTAWGFQTWLLLQNPNTVEANVNVTYMTASGPIKQPVVTMPPNSRQTINVNGIVPNMDTSIEVVSDVAICAERSMYWDNGSGKAGTDTIGFVSPDNNIYLAEGSTAWGFETFVCIQNPNDKATEVTVIYETNQGAVAGQKRQVPANSRITINVNDELPNRDTSIKLTCPDPIMAERSMYWNGRGAGHVSIGWVPPAATQ